MSSRAPMHSRNRWIDRLRKLSSDDVVLSRCMIAAVRTWCTTKKGAVGRKPNFRYSRNKLVIEPAEAGRD